jgi:predicted XRE-type DNA-binding protein
MTDVLNDAANDAVIDSSGNVFDDLGLPSSPEAMLKYEISRAIANRIRRRKLTQAQAAEIMKADQARVSNLLRGRLKDISTERMIRYLLALGLDVDIRLSGNGDNAAGKIKISQAA